MSTVPDHIRFILIDDNEIDLFFHDKLLRYQGISNDIVSFSGAQQALEYLSSAIHDPAMPRTVILLDIQMPEMDGFDFLKYFESFPPLFKQHCRILMVSSSLDFGDISRTNANALVAKLLRKPLEATELKAALADIFANNC